jgi:ATPase subunit of ABC transporter with duplicated ATPase domains
VLAEVLAGAGEVSGIERRMRHIEQELEEADDEEELAELMDEYGRLQHRFEAMGGYGIESEARRILAGLGFADADMERDIGEFSGGWMMRVALARLLLQNPDVLLLDEPTNHLDLASVEWLQGFLAQYAGAIVLVSHDRDFINEVANRVLELHDGRRPSTSATTPTSSSSAPSAWPSWRPRRRTSSARSRTRPGLHRALPLQGQQGTPGPVADQGAREARPGRRTRGSDAPATCASASRRRRDRVGR